MSKKNTKLKAFQETLKENNVTLANIEKNDELIRIIKRNADAVHDYRHPSYVRHFLGDIIMLTFFAVLANANEWGEIETFGNVKQHIEANLNIRLKLTFFDPFIHIISIFTALPPHCPYELFTQL